MAVELSGRGFDSAIVDVDLVYEILDPPLEPKTDASKWSEARRLAAQITSDLVGSRSAVVIEGEFATESQRAEFEDALPNDLDAGFVTLALDVDEAWRRASTDLTRGISRDRDFLVAHYEAWSEMPPIASDFAAPPVRYLRQSQRASSRTGFSTDQTGTGLGNDRSPGPVSGNDTRRSCH